MKTTFSRIPGACDYMDDIVICEATIEEHASELEMVSTLLKTTNLRLNL